METIKLDFKDFRIIPDFQSVHREAIPDEVYFSPKYSIFISNSRLKYINPLEGGSPQLFLENPRISTTSLSLGSAIHECILQPDEFELAPKIGKPGAKLGMVLDEIERLLRGKRQFGSFNELVREAALNVDYYSSSVDSKIEYIKSAWTAYQAKIEEVKAGKEKKQVIVSDADWDKVTACIKSIQENQQVMSLLHPVDVFGDPIETHNEDALFMDFVVTYKGKQCCLLRFKLKIDNWTIDYDNKIVTVNDLKTTKELNTFMGDDGSMIHYHYYRQLEVYKTILLAYLLREAGVTTRGGWTCNCNICAVETVPNYWSRSFAINDTLLKMGSIEFGQLMKRVAACEIFGYENNFEFA